MRRLASIFAAGALALATHSAAAAPDANVAQAGALFKEGVRLFQAGDFEGARAKFVVANGLVKSDGILWNLALAEAKSGHSADALNHFRLYLRSPKARPGDVQEAQTKWVPQMQGQAGELQIDGAEGASVTVEGGDAIGVLPMGWPYAVAPGHHRVEGHLGSEVTSREVDVGVGQTITVHLVAAAPVAAQAPVVPSAALVDTTGASPATSSAPAETATHAAPLRTWMTVGFGVAAVASAVGGIAFGAASKSAGNDAQNIRGGFTSTSCAGNSNPACSELKSDLDAQNRDHTLEIACFAGAGAFAAGAVLSWFLLPKTVESKSAFAPIVGPGTAGAQWVTHF